MSADPVEVLKPVYEQWARGNFRPVRGAYGPDLEWGWSEEFLELAGVEPGTEGRDERLLAWLGSWDLWRVEAEDYVAAGETVLVLTRYLGTGKGSGVEVDTEGAHLWTFREGRAVKLVVYADRERALEAAGLS